jgi:hypothetical protein
MKPARENDIPRATHEGVGEIFGVKVRTYHLDDGRAVIDADDFHKLLEALGFNGATESDLAAALAAYQTEMTKT